MAKPLFERACSYQIGWWVRARVPLGTLRVWPDRIEIDGVFWPTIIKKKHIDSITLRRNIITGKVRGIAINHHDPDNSKLIWTEWFGDNDIESVLKRSGYKIKRP